MAIALEIVGLSIDNAIEILNAANAISRISKINGKALVLTRDYKLDRYNLEIEDGMVIAVSFG